MATTTSLLPISCFSCNKIIAHLWEQYKHQRRQHPEPEQIQHILDRLGLKRYCCRRMFITHCDIDSRIHLYNNTFQTFDASKIQTKTKNVPERIYYAR